MASSDSTRSSRLDWWQEARFGMFVHWGLYTVDGLDCWKMHDMGTPVSEYVEALEPRFTGDGFDAGVEGVEFEFDN